MVEKWVIGSTVQQFNLVSIYFLQFRINLSSYAPAIAYLAIVAKLEPDKTTPA